MIIISYLFSTLKVIKPTKMCFRYLRHSIHPSAKTFFLQSIHPSIKTSLLQFIHPPSPPYFYPSIKPSFLQSIHQSLPHPNHPSIKPSLLLSPLFSACSLPHFLLFSRP